MEIAQQLRSCEGLIGVSRLSKLLGVHKMTVYAWVEKGLVPHHRLGNSLRFDGHEIAGWLDMRKVI